MGLPGEYWPVEISVHKWWRLLLKFQEHNIILNWGQCGHPSNALPVTDYVPLYLLSSKEALELALQFNSIPYQISVPQLYLISRCSLLFHLIIIRFFYMDHLKNLYWICSNIGSVLRFGFLAVRHMGSQLPNQGLNPYPLYWKAVLNTGPPRKFPAVHFKQTTARKKMAL